MGVRARWGHNLDNHPGMATIDSIAYGVAACVNARSGGYDGDVHRPNGTHIAHTRAKHDDTARRQGVGANAGPLQSYGPTLHQSIDHVWRHNTWTPPTHEYAWRILSGMQYTATMKWMGAVDT